jgi:hypothetical protein
LFQQQQKMGFNLQQAPPMPPPLPQGQPPLPRSDPPIINREAPTLPPNDLTGKGIPSHSSIDNGEGSRPVSSQSSGPSSLIENNVQGPSKPAETSLEDWNCQSCKTANFYFRPNCKCCGGKKTDQSKPIEAEPKASQPQTALPAPTIVRR